MSFISSLLLAITVVAHEPGYTTSLAQHVSRWLQGEGIAAPVVTSAQMSNALAHERLAFLVGFSSPTSAEMATLAKFRARGGKLVVFHSNASALAALMGVKPLGFAKAPYPGAWSRMRFQTYSILQTSTVLNRVAPLPGRGKVLATWADRSGKSTGEAAWVETDAGWWMSHVLLADGDENLKARLVASFCGAVDPRLWSAERSALRRKSEQAKLAAFAREQKPRLGEIHAVWEHSGAGLYPGDWPRTMRRLKEANVTDLFLNIAGAGFAHYPSHVLPRSKLCTDEGDQLARCLAAARGTGVRVHAWLLCFTATRSSPTVVDSFRKQGWCLRTPQGQVTDYLDPARSDVQMRLYAAMEELQTKYPSLAGVHLDFVRYDTRTVRPAQAAEVISRFVAGARRRVRRPLWLTVAVLGKYPACIASVGQDWDSWLNAKLVDYVVPMDYTASFSAFEGFVQQHARERTHARRTIAGIGVTANESRLDARSVIDQINCSRRYGLAGNALFDLDTTLDKEILPYLSLGAWSNYSSAFK